MFQLSQHKNPALIDSNVSEGSVIDNLPGVYGFPLALVLIPFSCTPHFTNSNFHNGCLPLTLAYALFQAVYETQLSP